MTDTQERTIKTMHPYPMLLQLLLEGRKALGDTDSTHTKTLSKT